MEISPKRIYIFIISFAQTTDNNVRLGLLWSFHFVILFFDFLSHVNPTRNDYKNIK